MPKSKNIPYKRVTFTLESPTTREPVVQATLGPDKVEAYYAEAESINVAALHAAFNAKFEMKHRLVEFGAGTLQKFNDSDNYGFQEAPVQSWSVGVIKKETILSDDDLGRQERMDWEVFVTIRHHAFKATTFGNGLPLQWVYLRVSWAPASTYGEAWDEDDAEITTAIDTMHHDHIFF